MDERPNLEESPPGTAEPTSVAPTTTVAAPAGPSRARWLIGGGIAIAAIAGLALVISILSTRPLPEVLKYVPADSAVIVELRPDLPGDQRQKLGNFLAHFPGFDDQSILDRKIDEALARMVQDATNGQVDYATRIKPLLAGPMAVAISSELFDAAATGANPEAMDRGVVLIATTDGTTTCDTILGTTQAGTAHRGVDVRALENHVACARHDRYLLLGDETSIGTALDARLDAKGADTASAYRAAHAKLEGDQVASVYISGAAFKSVLSQESTTLGMDLAALDDLWIIEGASFVDDALVVDTRAGGLSGVASPTFATTVPTVAPAAKSRFAERLPANTLGFLEVHGVGGSIERALAGLRADPKQAESLQQLETGLAALGGASNLIDWMEDAGIAIVPEGDTVGGAILIRGTSADAAAARITQIRNLLVLASTGTDITMHDSDHNGVKVTTVDLGDVGSLLEQLGMPSGTGGTTGGERVSFSFAVRDDVVILAVGDGLVEQLLDVRATDSLAKSPTYGRAINLAGDTNQLQVYVAVDSTLAVAERLLGTSDPGFNYEADIKPYLDHLGAVAGTSTASGSDGRFRLVLTVK